MNFNTLNSETKYRGKAFDVRLEQVSLPDGNTALLDIVVHQPSVTILPIDDQGLVWFVNQYRHPAQQHLLELPAGVLEENETPLACARRELREEIGMDAGNIEKIGEFFLAPGYSTEFMYVFKANDLHPAPLQRDADEFMTVEKISLQDVRRLVAEHKIRDCKSLAALYLSLLGSNQ
jgi:ADP-ribose pyrophosphatase